MTPAVTAVTIAATDDAVDGGGAIRSNRKRQLAATPAPALRKPIFRRPTVARSVASVAFSQRRRPSGSRSAYAPDAWGSSRTAAGSSRSSSGGGADGGGGGWKCRRLGGGGADGGNGGRSLLT